ncbi:MAG: glycine zipper domain-containing protein [Bacteroidota bacterium]|nr:glycine zipper domain-containing protein [Bacteroidota bacterium]
MKFLLVGLVVAFSLTACNNSKTVSEPIKEIVADSSTNYNNSVLTDTASVMNEAAVPVVALPAETKKPVPASNHAVRKSTAKTNVVTNTPAPVVPVTTAPAQVTEPTAAAEPAPQVVEEKKKGWSSAAKDAVIGGGAGAIGGAIISKKKVKGAIIGGVIGAAGGYIIGRSKDKKDTTR